MSRRVVLTPELVVRALGDADCLRTLNAWRDGILHPVVNRELTLRYIKALRAAGVGPKHLKRWLWWFSAKGKTDYLSGSESDSESAPQSAFGLCDELASANDAECVVHSDVFTPPNGERKATWQSASKILS